MSFSIDYARRLLRTLEEEIAPLVDLAAAGSPGTDAEYRALVGRIRGLRRARDIVVLSLASDERSEFAPRS